MITAERTFFDYGCGHGDDLAGLREDGVICDGFDPVYRPEVVPQTSDVVNIGYVINVIEDLEERRSSIQKAWAIARRVLCVAARVVMGESSGREIEYGDGLITSIGTFQKYFTQSELREYIETSLGSEAHPAAPGVFYVFRDEELKSQFLSDRVRRRLIAPQKRIAEFHFEEHKAILEPLMESVLSLGRLPSEDEFELSSAVVDAFGSLKRAFSIIKKVTGEDEWDSIHAARVDDLTVYIALAKFSRRPTITQLPRRIQIDIKAFFGSYKNACDTADALLFQAGDTNAIDKACVDSPIGRLTSNALWIHRNAVPYLSPILRIYEGCGRAYVGSMDDMNIVKLHRFSGKISYLSCEEFETDPHPPLTATVKVSLRTLRLDYFDNSVARNPLLLDSKDSMVPRDYTLRSKFARLTMQELNHGVLATDMDFRSKQQWNLTLDCFGFIHRGHQLIKKRG